MNGSLSTDVNFLLRVSSARVVRVREGGGEALRVKERAVGKWPQFSSFSGTSPLLLGFLNLLGLILCLRSRQTGDKIEPVWTD